MNVSYRASYDNWFQARADWKHPGEEHTRLGKDKQRGGGKKTHLGETRLTPSLCAAMAAGILSKLVEPLTIEINAAGHDIHRIVYIDGGASFSGSITVRTLLPKTAP
ncbi:hypothetical protein Tco_1458342 [Tanacetum coccineum]